MKHNELADLINGREVGNEITTEECQQAKAKTLEYMRAHIVDCRAQIDALEAKIATAKF